MRISFITETFLPKTDGIVTRLCATIQWLQNNGHTVQVIAPQSKLTEYAGAQIKGIPAHAFFLYRDMPVSLPDWHVGQYLAEFQPDLVHVVNPALLGVAGIFYSRKLHLPLVASYHTNIPQYADFYHLPWLKPILWWYFRFLHNRAQLNLCTSETIKTELTRRKFRNVSVWSRGVAVEQFGPEHFQTELRDHLSSHRPQNTLLLYVGRLAAEKQIECLRAVLDASPNLSLAIIGDGPHRAALEKYFAGSNTIFTGFLHGSDLAAAYASSDLFVFPSTTETLGLVILEAMASGLPVIAADSGPTREQIRPGYNGLLFQPSVPNSLKEAVLSLQNPERLQTLSSNALTSGRQFGWARPSAQLLAFYRDILLEEPEQAMKAT